MNRISKIFSRTDVLASGKHSYRLLEMSSDGSRAPKNSGQAPKNSLIRAFSPRLCCSVELDTLDEFEFPPICEGILPENVPLLLNFTHVIGHRSIFQ